VTVFRLSLVPVNSVVLEPVLLVEVAVAAGAQAPNIITPSMAKTIKVDILFTFSSCTIYKIFVEYIDSSSIKGELCMKKLCGSESDEAASCSIGSYSNRA